MSLNNNLKYFFKNFVYARNRKGEIITDSNGRPLTKAQVEAGVTSTTQRTGPGIGRKPALKIKETPKPKSAPAASKPKPKPSQPPAAAPARPSRSSSGTSTSASSQRPAASPAKPKVPDSPPAPKDDSPPAPRASVADTLAELRSMREESVKRQASSNEKLKIAQEKRRQRRKPGS